MTFAPVLRSSLFLLGILILGAALLVLAFFLISSEADRDTLVSALEERGIPAALLQSLCICFVCALLAFLIGLPLGVGAAGMERRRQRWALCILILFAIFPVPLTVTWNAIGLSWPYAISLVLAASSWTALAGAMKARGLSDSIASAAVLSGAPLRTILRRIYLPRVLPAAVAGMFGSFLLLFFLEGTVFSAAVCIFEQSERQGQLFPALFALLLLVFPLFSILVYIYMVYASGNGLKAGGTS